MLWLTNPSQLEERSAVPWNHLSLPASCPKPAIYFDRLITRTWTVVVVARQILVIPCGQHETPCGLSSPSSTLQGKWSGLTAIKPFVEDSWYDFRCRYWGERLKQGLCILQTTQTLLIDIVQRYKTKNNLIGTASTRHFAAFSTTYSSFFTGSWYYSTVHKVLLAWLL